MKLFVAAEPRECEPWVARWSDVHPVDLPVHWARAGKWMGRDAMAIANGAGPERAHDAVMSAPKPDAVCSMGFCGALDSAMAVGDIFVATEIRNGAVSYRTADLRGPGARRGVLTSQSRIAQTAEEKRNLRAAGAFAVEMEAAGAARASEEIRAPFYCVKVVSDLADEDFVNNFNDFLMPNGKVNVTRLVLRAFADPVRRFNELIRLSKRTAVASKNLGDFLAHCDF
ncbi:MAG: hypothetical protein KGN84_18205 [Acidobacteriota bacterium]|nr:hypothetical protein [Acidobacteriota bacterium]